MDYLPIFLNLKQQRCLVVGGGDIAARKIDLLVKAGAQISVVAPELKPVLSQLQQEHGFEVRLKNFTAEDLNGVQLVISATNQASVNQQVYQAAQAQGLWVNVVDNPALCNFIFPAIVDRSPVIIAISTGGSSPVLARLLRGKLESLIPASYGKLASMADQFRNLVKQCITNPAERRLFWENTLQGNVAEQVFAGNQRAAESLLRQNILNHQAQTEIGEVYLVGAGPGDPDLLTFRALRLMQQADVIVYDRLVSAEIMELTRRDAEKIYVGKQRKNHSLPQESINELLVKLALEGKRVLRLKGGDPFIFGRGGEEIETLAEHGIRFQVVPGITAASGCASYAGIPLTHRDHAQSCLFVTGHLKDNSINLNWPQLTLPNQTVVIYMGLVGLDIICQQLIKHGLPNTHPIAIVQQGTTSSQKVITGTLSTLPDQVTIEEIKAPTLIIVGSVVTLHNKLNWFHPDS